MTYSFGNYYDPGFMDYNMATLHTGHGLWGDDFNVQNLWQMPTPCMSNPMFGFAPNMFASSMFPTAPQQLGGFYNGILSSQAMSNSANTGGSNPMGKMLQFMMFMKQMESLDKKGSSSKEEQPPATTVSVKGDDVELDDFEDFINNDNSRTKLEYKSAGDLANKTFEDLSNKEFSGLDASEGTLTINEFKKFFSLDNDSASAMDADADGNISKSEYTDFLTEMGISFNGKNSSITKGEFDNHHDEIKNKYIDPDTIINALDDGDDIDEECTVVLKAGSDPKKAFQLISLKAEEGADKVSMLLTGKPEQKEAFYEQVAAEFNDPDISAADIKNYFNSKATGENTKYEGPKDGVLAVDKSDKESIHNGAVQTLKYIQAVNLGREVDDLEINAAEGKTSAQGELVTEITRILNHPKTEEEKELSKEMSKIFDFNGNLETHELDEAEVAAFLHIADTDKKDRGIISLTHERVYNLLDRDRSESNMWDNFSVNVGQNSYKFDYNSSGDLEEIKHENGANTWLDFIKSAGNFLKE